MPGQVDKGKVISQDESDLMGAKPYSEIGPDRTSEEAAKDVVKKLKKKKAVDVADGDTFEKGEAANVSGAIGKMVNK